MLAARSQDLLTTQLQPQGYIASMVNDCNSNNADTWGRLLKKAVVACCLSLTVSFFKHHITFVLPSIWPCVCLSKTFPGSRLLPCSLNTVLFPWYCISTRPRPRSFPLHSMPNMSSNRYGSRSPSGPNVPDQGRFPLRPRRRNVRQLTPQEQINDFWSKFTTETPGKGMSQARGGK